MYQISSNPSKIWFWKIQSMHLISTVLLFMIIAQKAIKLQSIKIGGPKKLFYVSTFNLVKRVSIFVHTSIFFRPQRLTGHSFVAPWAIMMNSSSFESPKSYLFGHYLRSESKKRAHVQNWSLVKNLHFLIYPHETWCK